MHLLREPYAQPQRSHAENEFRAVPVFVRPVINNISVGVINIIDVATTLGAFVNNVFQERYDIFFDMFLLKENR